MMYFRNSPSASLSAASASNTAIARQHRRHDGAGKKQRRPLKLTCISFHTLLSLLSQLGPEL
jgi:hypothetical protein